MPNSNPNPKDRIESHIRSDQATLRRCTLADEAVVCHQCGARLQAGRQVTVYAYREPADADYTIGHVWCGLSDHTPQIEYTLGLRELRVSGTVGQCSDVRTQTTWQVLLAPTVERMSPAATTDGQPIEPDAVSLSAQDVSPGTSSLKTDSVTSPTDRAER